MKTHSLRFKTSIWYSGVLVVILGLFSVYLYGTIRHILLAQIKQELKLKAGQIEAFLDAYASISSQENLMKQYLSATDENASPKWIIDHLWAQDSKSLGLKSDFFRILSPRGRVRLRSENMTGQLDHQFDRLFPLHPDKMSFMALPLNNSFFYGISYPFRFANRNAFVLELAAPAGSIRQILDQLVLFMAAGILALLVITVFMGTFLTRRILKPVAEVTLTANNISQTNLHLRIPQGKLDQEMEELINSFNRMIGRLEGSFAHINDFSSHVAHELKTPLAVIKTELELALAKDNPLDEDKRVMQVALGEINRLVKTIKDLLLLAKFEYKFNLFKMEEIDVIAFLKDVYQHAQILGTEHQINMELVVPDDRIFLKGDMVHLRRIFFNLLHNAIKCTPANGHITVFAGLQSEQVMVIIKDTGCGIAPEDQPHIFEKFYRSKQAGHDSSGNGLGLCLARMVARSHGGDITFESQWNKGSAFTVTLPISHPQHALIQT